MVLVDTSVWIHALAGRGARVRSLDALLESDAVLAHDLVEGELMVGDAGGRGPLLDAYAAIQRARTLPHAEVAAFVRARRLHGRGIGWIDAHLLASALVEHAPLWTHDRALGVVAEELGVAYEAAS